MCIDPQATAVKLLTAIKPAIFAALPFLGITSILSTQISTYYDAAVAAVQNWKKGTPSEEAEEALGLLGSVLASLPLPEGFKEPFAVILAAIQAVIGIVSANAPAPVSSGDASEEHVTVMHQMAVAADTEAKVKALVPHFERSLFHSPESQFNKTWNASIEANKLPDSLKV